jgi:hypothetical protein
MESESRRIDYFEATKGSRTPEFATFIGVGLLPPRLLGGYACVLLDTLDAMESARALYQELGFEDIPPYCHNPMEVAHYLKVEL